MSISLDEAVELTRTGDVWVFRGRSGPDRAIQLTTNSPVNHVGMAVVLDDMPPLMWHAELGRSLPDMWTGTHQRGVQLHVLRDAVCVWANRYGQRGWLRQLEPPADAEMEKAVLRTVARLDGTPFPSTTQLAWRWARGRVPQVRLPGLRRPGARPGDAATAEPAGGGAVRDRALETAYCAEVVAVTYEAMGLLPAGRRPNWYDPGRFWSGDDLGLAAGAQLGAEIEVSIPPR
ncbi:hypothetical protein OOK41_12890 [Micromonospora sp. NBC_01655]|uniref:hypothetical protein n=1 Tax=Micromonospora sp. NBC_01655 TaxID=2975983 RepID=UPI00225BA89D|nr:hypothetical protein [Micromonospora sp. NBC_01655]MCX4471198.1 hypothetical protein [Micromonospora sp. NBC_01655]